jgi:hypothetical protein
MDCRRSSLPLFSVVCCRISSLFDLHRVLISSTLGIDEVFKILDDQLAVDSVLLLLGNDNAI